MEESMHILIINFQLKELSPAAFAAHCAQVAPLFVGLPGLIAKYWLANPATNIYGGVYLWQDQMAMERYRTSELCQRIATNPHFINVTMQDFAVLPEPSAITSGIVETLETAA
jgi:hypothetical protein